MVSRRRACRAVDSWEGGPQPRCSVASWRAADRFSLQVLGQEELAFDRFAVEELDDALCEGADEFVADMVAVGERAEALDGGVADH